jgi:hypothetical protein
VSKLAEGSIKRVLNTPPNEQPSMEISPELDAAMRGLKELFSDPKIRSTASFRCCVDGPTEFEVLFESIVDEQFGYNANSEYKCWVRSLYRLGLILRIPSEWEATETPEGKSPA